MPFSGGLAYSPPAQAESAVSVARTLSMNTALCGVVFADPQNGISRATRSGNQLPHWKAVCAPIERPSTSCSRSMPNLSVTRRSCARTLSSTVVRGKRIRSLGAAVLLGEEDRPLPNRFGLMMKWRAGSSGRPGPISHSLLRWVDENQVGNRIALSRTGESVPYVL